MSCFDDDRLATRPMSADEVFAAIVYASKLQADVEFPELLPDPTADITIHEWRMVYELSGWPLLEHSVRNLFGIDLTVGEYRELLKDWKQTKLTSICERIARHAFAPVAEPVTFFGDTSLAAGMFLAVRRILAECGANVSDLRPSSPITPYLSRYWQKLVPALVRLAPGQLPALRSDVPSGVALAWIIVGSFALWGLGKLIGNSNMSTCGALSCYLFLLVSYFWDRVSRPKVTFAYAPTFRELCQMLAGERAPHGPAFPVVVRRVFA
jgi:hypothetical protein